MRSTDSWSCSELLSDDLILEIMATGIAKREGVHMLHESESKEEISRRSFLKLGFAGISGAALLLLSGCLGEEEDDEDDDDD